MYVQVVGNLQSLVTLKVTYAFELPGSFTDRVEAMDLQHFSRLSALRWLTIDIHDNKPEGEMLEEELINLYIEPEAGLPLQLPSLPSLTSLHVMNKAGGQRLMLSNHMLHGLCRLRHLHVWGARLDFSSEDLPGAWQKLEVTTTGCNFLGWRERAQFAACIWTSACDYVPRSAWQ